LVKVVRDFGASGFGKASADVSLGV
jgi:hypothetical protein